MLNISGFYDNSCTNGEGWRSVIFFSGCPHKCKGCHNPETWAKGSGEDFSVDELTQKVFQNADFIDGVTFSGGEPFQEENIEELMELADIIHTQGLDIWCYTGYEYDFLKEHSLFSKLLEKIDVLVDGPYIEELFDPDLRFRGSSNQKIIEVVHSKTTVNC